MSNRENLRSNSGEPELIAQVYLEFQPLAKAHSFVNLSVLPNLGGTLRSVLLKNSASEETQEFSMILKLIFF